MTATDWNTLASVATALGTLVLAVATFAAIRTASRAARIAERAMIAGLSPVLMPTRLEDATQKVNFGDRKWVVLPGGGAVAEIGGGDGSMGATDDVIYLAIALRNAGTGMAVLHGWILYPGWHRSDGPPDPDRFRQHTRDLYVPSGDIGFWQGALRDRSEPLHAEAHRVIEAREPWTVDLMYGDHEVGERVISRFTVFPRGDQDWVASSTRHWNIDRAGTVRN
ncbi:MAG TPA: hypothetical protein VKU39_06245 [Streptosporangiaceae bacterium]|nr:hypothetical protein [Streptosporangiaceae bacterium]